MIRKLLLAVALLLPGPVLAQAQALPQFAVDKTGICRKLQVRDVLAGSQLTLGCINGAGFQPQPAQVDNTFTLTGRLYNTPDSAHLYSRTMAFTAPAGTRAIGQGGLNLSLTDPGSGTVSSPALAGIPLTIDAGKAGYLGSPTPGEVDGINIGVRQDNGDASGILVNVSGVARGSGAGTFSSWESHTTLVDPVANAVTQDINTQLGVVNSAGLGQVGLFASKWKGSTGAGVYVDSLPGASWDYGIQLRSGGMDYFAVRASDGAILHYNSAGSVQYAQTNDGGYERVYYQNTLVASWAAGGLLMTGDLVVQAAAPATSSGPACSTGAIRTDPNFIYVCVATNTWKRAALSSF